jgi:hypothetical protein
MMLPSRPPKPPLPLKVQLVPLLPDVPLALPTDASDTHSAGVLQKQVRELLAAQGAISHFFAQFEGWQFQLWTDHKLLVAAMTRAMLPASGQQQRHLAFITEHTCKMQHTPGIDNVVADALSWPTAPPPDNHFVQEYNMVAAAVANSGLSPLDLKEMAL